MNNAQIIKAIGIDDDIKPMAKYTLIICIHVCMDWKTYTGQISADQIAIASNQSSRQVKRHLKALVEAGWLSRQAELRDSGLHHKSFTSLNQQRVIDLLSKTNDVTEKVNAVTEKVSYGVTEKANAVTEKVNAVTEGVNYAVTEKVNGVTEKVSYGVTEKVNAVTEGVNYAVTEKVSYDVTEKVSDNYDTDTVTEKVSYDVTEKANPLPKMSHISIYPNYNNQFNNNNSSELETSTHASASEIESESDMEENYHFCDRCRQWVKSDQEHLYPHSKLRCTDQKPEIDMTTVWDRAWGQDEEEVREDFRDGLWYVNRIDSEIEYRQETYRQCTHHKRYDVRDALFLPSGLFPQMMKELIAPRSAIDWVTLQAAGHLPAISTPSAPPKESKTIIVTVEEQQRIKEIDRAWGSSADAVKGTDEW